MPMSLENEIVISFATASDLDDLHEIESLCFLEGNAASKEAFLYRLENFPSWFFKATISGKIIGFINGCSSRQRFITDDLFKTDMPYDEKAENFLIFGLAVHPEFRNRSAAKKLMNTALEFARARKKRRAALTCEERLIPFYESFSFKNVGVSKSCIGGLKYFDMEIAL